MASPSQPILTLQALRQIWVTVPVPEEVNRKVAVGHTATVRFDAIPRRTFSGRIVQVNPAADAASRQFNIRIGLGNSEGLLKPGMFARAALITDRKPGVVTIPREAVQQSKDRSIAVVVEGEEAKHRPVVLGASDPAGYEVRSGLREGERVVVLSGAPVRDGTKVRVAGPQKKAAAENPERTENRR